MHDAVEDRARLMEFLQRHAVAAAADWDAAGRVPPAFLQQMAEAGYFGTLVSEADGGLGWDAHGFGMLCEQVGMVSGSLLSILTVHSMATHAVAQWGTSVQKAQWLRELATGRKIGAFALTEPEIGSDAAHILSEVAACDDGFRLTGHKKWISFGQHADLFLVMARMGLQSVALLVPRDTPGFAIAPMGEVLGFRAAGLAELTFDGCVLPQEALVGAVGSGFSHIASACLDVGRYCIAFGCLGMIEACTMDAVLYARNRRQFDVPLIKHQLIQELLADMMTDAQMVRQLCSRAATLRQAGDPESILATTMAKYAASRFASKVASAAVQVHGANGCATGLRVERMFRDARICEIIEGSNQMQQMMIARNGVATYLKLHRTWEKAANAG